MPLLGIVVLLILLFLRRELISAGRDGMEGGAPGDSVLPNNAEPQMGEQVSGWDAPAARPQRGADEDGAPGGSALPENVEPEKGDQAPGRDAPAARPQHDADEDGAPGESALPEIAEPEKGEQAPGRDAPAARPLRGTDEDGAPGGSASSAETAKPETREPVAKEWPMFTLSGIAVGRERLAMLSSGEMLTAGEVAKSGVKVEKVESASVVFSWRGETKTLRKGEQSDKPADAPNAQGNK